MGATMTKKTTYKVVLSYIILTTLFIPFQNCSKSQFSTMKNNSEFLNSTESASLSDPSLVGDMLNDNPAPNTPVPSVPKICRFNGAVVPEGQSRTAYQNSSVAFGQSCVSEERYCLNGDLQGSFSFGSCNVNAPASCLFNNQTIAHGGSVVAYQNSTVPFGSSCLNTSENRVCNNGVLSGSNNFSSCLVGAPSSCLFDGQVISHGGSVTAYQNSNAGFGSSCVSEQRTCLNGSLGGSYNFGNCAVDAAASCSFNGSTIAHGENVTAFASSTVPFGGSCDSQVRSCSNGVLSGSNLFANCAVDAPASCLFNQKTLAHSESVIAYASSSVPFGTSCDSQSRSCSNGSLSGSNQFASCMIDAPASCLINGKTVAHGEIINTFASARVPFGSSCVAVPASCNNGQLSNSNTHTSCEVLPLVCAAGQFPMNSQCVQMYSVVAVNKTHINGARTFTLGTYDRCVLTGRTGDLESTSHCRLSVSNSVWSVTIQDEGDGASLTCLSQCSQKSTAAVTAYSNTGSMCTTSKADGIRMANGKCCSGTKNGQYYQQKAPARAPTTTGFLGIGSTSSGILGQQQQSSGLSSIIANIPVLVSENDLVCE